MNHGGGVLQRLSCLVLGTAHGLIAQGTSLNRMMQVTRTPSALRQHRHC